MNVRTLLQRFSHENSANHDTVSTPKALTSARPAALTSLPNVSQWIDPEPWIDLTTVAMANDIETYRERDLLPIPPTANREGYHGERHYDYWLSGLKDYLQIKARTTPLLQAFNDGIAILDFGCASGRVLRHFLCQEEAVQVWGCDLNVDHVRWNTKFLGSGPRFFANSIYPTLPIEDNSMSLIYAMSVFTHIDEYELTWLAELRRILKPGGVAYITVHTDHTWQILGPNHALYYALKWLIDQGRDGKSFEQLLTSPMPDERIVFQWGTGNSQQVNVFHSEAYLRAYWGNYFDVVEIIPEGADYQDVIILQK